MDLVHRYFTLDKELDLRLNMPIVNIGTLFNVKFVSVMHDYSCRPKESLFVLLEFKPDHHRTIKAPFVPQFKSLINFPELPHLSLRADKCKPYHYPAIIPLPVTYLELYLVPLPIVIVAQ